jgi:CRISPR-associated protein Csm2
MRLINDQELKDIIERGNNEVLVDKASDIGKALARQLTTSQIRGIFGSVRRIELDWQDPRQNPDPRRVAQAQREFALLRPRLAYQARRERGRGVEDLRDVLDPAMEIVGNNHTYFRNFVDFFEAILAYHKAAGGQ